MQVPPWAWGYWTYGVDVWESSSRFFFDPLPVHWDSAYHTKYRLRPVFALDHVSWHCFFAPLWLHSRCTYLHVFYMYSPLISHGPDFCCLLAFDCCDPETGMPTNHWVTNPHNATRKWVPLADYMMYPSIKIVSSRKNDKQHVFNYIRKYHQLIIISYNTWYHTVPSTTLSYNNHIAQ